MDVFIEVEFSRKRILGVWILCSLFCLWSTSSRQDGDKGGKKRQEEEDFLRNSHFSHSNGCLTSVAMNHNLIHVCGSLQNETENSP